jgi:hypothetical protein
MADLQFAYFLIAMTFFSFVLQCLVITEFQAKKMGFWGIPCLLGFFLLKMLRYFMAIILQAGKKATGLEKENKMVF